MLICPHWHLLFRFKLVIIYPVLQVFLLSIINILSNREDKVIKIGDHWVWIKPKIWKIGEKGWIRVARVGLPIACLLIAITILGVGGVSQLLLKTG